MQNNKQGMNLIMMGEMSRGRLIRRGPLLEEVQ